MRHNDARGLEGAGGGDGGGGGFIANGVLKIRKVIKFQNLCPATALLYR